MTVYIALLRAVNVGGTGKLPMTELTTMCTDAGFESVKTYIASGNVVFTSKLAATTTGTARIMNTVRKLVSIAQAISIR